MRIGTIGRRISDCSTADVASLGTTLSHRQELLLLPPDLVEVENLTTPLNLLSLCATQVWDMRSIPIARSINLDDSVDLTRLS